jgi:hypothetical protein
MNVRFFFLAAALSLTAACAAHRQLRTSTVPVDVTAPLSDPRTRAAVETTSIERYPGYTIAIVEFDDQGRFESRHGLAADTQPSLPALTSRLSRTSNFRAFRPSVFQR